MANGTAGSGRSTWVPPLLWTAGYLAVGMTVAFAQPDRGQSPWYPPTAIGIALLLRCGRRWWPLILAADLVVSYAQYRMAGPAAASAAVTTVEAVVGVTLLVRWRFDPQFTNGEDVMRLAVVAGTVALGGALVGVPLVRAAGFVDGTWLDMIRVWFIGELTGITVFLPVLLLVAAQPSQLRRRLGGLPLHQALELAGLTVIGVALAGWVFFRIGPGIVQFADVGPTLVCLLPVMWVAIRFGRARTAVVSVTMNVVVVMAVVQGHGAAVTSLVDYESVQFFMLVVSLAGLGVAVTVDAERSARSLQQAVIDASPIAVILVDDERHVRVWNPAAEHIFGWPAAEVLGREPPAITPEGQAAFRARLDAQRLGPVEATVAYRHRDGHRIDGRLHGAPVRDAEGEITGMMGLIEDVTGRLADERQRALLSTAIDQAAEAVVLTDLKPAIVYANPAAVDISGYSLEDMLGRDPSLFASGAHDRTFFAGMWADLLAGRAWHGVIVNRHRRGSLYEQDAIISPVLDADGRVQAYVSVSRDLTIEHRLQADLVTEQQERHELAATLSGVATGLRPEATADALCTAACSIEDLEGAILLRRLPDGNLLVLGADVPETVPLPTVALSSEISAAVVALSIAGPWYLDPRDAPLGEGPVSDALEREGLTGVAGVAVTWQGHTVGVLGCGTRHPDGVERLRRRGAALTEIATHAAALLGPDLVALDDRDLGRNRIGDLIEQDAFHPVFQPVISLETGAVVGYEALTRFDNGTRPDLVFAEAHEVGMGHDLERACLRASLDAAQGLPEPTWLAINVSPTLVLAGEVAPLLAGLDRRIVLEITEHVEIPDYAALRHGLERIEGVWVSVDDAGAGYASLRHILELRPDIVKLDIALVRGIDADPARQAMVAGMRHFASETLTHLLAEGVETQAEADTVRRLGVEYVQGYLFGRPEPLPAPA